MCLYIIYIYIYIYMCVYAGLWVLGYEAYVHIYIYIYIHTCVCLGYVYVNSGPWAQELGKTPFVEGWGPFPFALSQRYLLDMARA